MNMYEKREQRKNKKEVESNNVEQNQTKTNINWYPGHMAKTRRQIRENIKMVDVVYEVVDARIPISSKIKDIDDIVKDKPRILIMTKQDLCDVEKTMACAKAYEKKGYKVILVDLINNKGIDKIFSVTNELLKGINEVRAKKELKPRAYRALIIGIPNVGKSTLINRLVGKNITITGDKPGVTKHLSWIRINKNIELLDSPGILWPRLDDDKIALNLAAFSAIKEEILPLGKVAVYILEVINKKYHKEFAERYGEIDFEAEDVIPTYELIGKKRGCVMSGGRIDYDKVSSIIVKDLREGRLGKVTFDEV